MKKFLSNILEYDLFGVNLSFTYLKKEKHGTFFSLFLSFILVSICIWKLVNHSLKLLNKEDLEFKIHETSSVNDTIILKNLNLEICIFPYDKYNISEIANIELITDNETLYTNKTQIIKQKDSDCLIFNYNDKYFDYINTTSDLKYSKPSGIFIQLNYTKIKDLLEFVIYTNKTYVNLQNYNELFNTYEEYYSFQARPNKHILLEFMIDKLKIESSNDILSFGIFEPSLSPKENFTFGQYYLKSYNIGEKIEEITKEQPQEQGNIIILFRHSKLIKIFNITSFSIESLLSQLGGYIQIMTFIFTFLGENYNMWSLNRKIKKRFNDRLENFRKNNNVSMNEINISYKDSNDTIKNDSKLKERLYELRDLSNSDTNTKYSNDIINNHPETIVEDLIDEFYNLFDYENLYEAFKEIILLKYLLLNQAQRHFINSYKKYPIDFRKQKLLNESEFPHS